ncbi:MAG: ATP-binding cassette domain-containing protein [Clostridia bacterium]|nr:ATP-binding cassette domain-containing protein [Clostridia bacterium]
MAYFEIRNLGKSFGDNRVFHDVSLKMEKGEIVSVIGPSGVGKSTLLRCLNLLDLPDTGSYYVNDSLIYEAGKDETDSKLRESRLHFGLVFQSFNLFPQYTVLENILLAPKVKDKEKAMELLSHLELTEKANEYPFQLSGGQMQRVAIARALILNPDVLCFDEPTSALDPLLSDSVCALVRSLKSEDKAIIVVTHDMKFAKNVSDRIVTLKDGMLQEVTL